MASQSAGTGDHRNKDRCLYAALPSTCRAADRHDPEGISGPDAVRTMLDLERKLLEFQHYYNGHRAHAGLAGRLPESGAERSLAEAKPGLYRWQKHCRGLYQTPIAA